MNDVFDNPEQAIPRDRWGRPMVVPPNGGKPTAYTRCTTFVDCLEDKYNLQAWEKRMVARGLAARPDLLLAVTTNSDEKDKAQKQELNRVTDSAKEAAKASAAATTGTALHALTEKIDRGEELPYVPDAYLADLEAYRRETAALEPVLIEQFTVQDELRIGGTADRIVNYSGRGYIADVKTGSSIDFGALKIAMQLSVYSRSTPYDHETKKRSPFPLEVDTAAGIVIHLPAGTGACELRWVDLQAGWAAVSTAAQVREWRKRKDWYEPFKQAPSDGTSFDPAPSYLDEVAAAVTVTELRQVHARAVRAAAYGDELHAACLARKAAIEGAA